MRSLQGNLTNSLTSVLLVIGLTMSGPLYAQSVGADTTKVSTADWRQWKTVGQAKLTWFIFDIYESRLRAPDGRYQVSADVSPHPFALEIYYQRDVTKQQLLEVTEEQWQKLGVNQQRRQQWLSELNEMYPNIKKGDELAYVTDGKSGHLLYRRAGEVSPVTVGYVEDEGLNDAFLSIWLSPKTEFPKLRKQLIGQVR
ncbi:chalcone isomerase family protein [Vibrio sp. EA2]|uniref:chalcone isomerase family protein n=1 Tax=Vibrio sp. EA2 TaxID=3079860 RepID=UPI00294A2230|nr:chalcone isomerase family protein [Vibrio sp. EA2]MDV6250718.1 chalcone isomerase family protein [Vibrio sp. EA2]